MRTLLTLFLAAWLCPMAAAAQADKDKSDKPEKEKPARIIVEERYGAAIRKALITRPTDDDLALAEELLAVAKAAETSGDMLAELADQTFLLASRDPAGTDLALEAMDLVAATLPDKAAAAREKAIQFLRRGVSVADAEQKAAAAHRMMDYLQKLAEERAAASDFGGAAKLYQQAMLAAGDAKLPEAIADLKVKFEGAAAREKLEQRIELAIEALAKNPMNATVCSELVTIYVVELDNPVAAARYAPHCNDEKAKKLVPLAIGKLQDLSPAQCMELGEWYEKLTGEASAMSKPALMQRARRYYEQFLLLPATDSVQQLRAVLGIARARDLWMKQNPVKAERLAIPDERGWFDVLKGLETARYRVAGRWKRDVDAITVNAGDEPARLMLTATASEAYELTVRFTRSSGDGAVAVMLPVGERAACRVVLSGWHGKASGLYTIEGDGSAELTTGVRRNSTSTTAVRINNDTEYLLAIRVITQGDNVTITAQLDGKEWLSWTGAQSRLTLDSEWALRDDHAIGLGADFGSVRFSSVQLRSLRGDARLIDKPQTLLERGSATPLDGFVDLLELWEAAGDSVTGSWVRQGDAITTDKRGEAASTLLPALPQGNYVLRVKFERPNRKPGPIAFSLPMFDTAVVAILGGGTGANIHGLSMLEGKDYDANKSTKTGPAIAAARTSLLECRASFEEDQAKIEIDLDGDSLIRWSGPRTQLTLPTAVNFKGGAQPGLGMGASEVIFHRAELKMLTGSAKFTRGPAAAKPAMALGEPINLLKDLNPDKQTTSGVWQLARNQLNTTADGTNAQSSIMLPLAIEGNYEMDLKFIRTLGRGIVTVYLPVGTGGVDLKLALSNGKFDNKVGALSVPPTPRGVVNNNLISTEAVRFVNNMTYHLHVKVQTEGNKATIKIDLDGKPYLNWTGPAAVVRGQTMPDTHNPHAVGVHVLNPVARSGMAILEAQVKMTSGQAKPLN